MKNLLLVAVVALGLTACTTAERQDVLNDIGVEVGADAGEDGVYQIGEIVPEIAQDVGEKAGNPIELLFYGAGIGAVALLGWIKRKFIYGKYKQVKDAVVKKPE